MIGGVVGAYLVYYAMSFQGVTTGMDFIAIMFGAYAFGAVFQDLVNRAFPTT